MGGVGGPHNLVASSSVLAIGFRVSTTPNGASSKTLYRRAPTRGLADAASPKGYPLTKEFRCEELDEKVEDGVPELQEDEIASSSSSSSSD